MYTSEYVLFSMHRRSQRSTGRSHAPATVPTRIRPTARAPRPNSASAATAEQTHTGRPRNESRFPLSASPFQVTVRAPAVSVQSYSSRVRRTLRYRRRTPTAHAAKNTAVNAAIRPTGACAIINPPATRRAPHMTHTAVSSPPNMNVKANSSSDVQTKVFISFSDTAIVASKTPPASFTAISAQTGSAINGYSTASAPPLPAAAVSRSGLTAACAPFNARYNSSPSNKLFSRKAYSQ